MEKTFQVLCLPFGLKYDQFGGFRFNKIDYLKLPGPGLKQELISIAVTGKLQVVFEVISDYGQVRGFSETEIAGLTSWRSDGGYAGARGGPSKSPWE